MLGLVGSEQNLTSLETLQQILPLSWAGNYDYLPFLNNLFENIFKGQWSTCSWLSLIQKHLLSFSCLIVITWFFISLGYLLLFISMKILIFSSGFSSAVSVRWAASCLSISLNIMWHMKDLLVFPSSLRHGKNNFFKEYHKSKWEYTEMKTIRHSHWEAGSYLHPKTRRENWVLNTDLPFSSYARSVIKAKVRTRFQGACIYIRCTWRKG